MRNRTTRGRLTRQTQLGLAIAVGLSAFTLGASPAFAQVATMAKVKPGQTVWVTRPNGTTIRGKVIAIAEAGLELKDGDRRTSLQLADVQRIETRDSLRNGAIIGAIPTAILFGLGAGTATAVGCFMDATDSCNRDTKSATVMGAVVGAGIGALIGAGIDRAIPGRRVLYRRPAAATTVTIAPVVSARGAGVGMALRW
jgi:hypothetical protein